MKERLAVKCLIGVAVILALPSIAIVAGLAIYRLR